MLSLVQLIQSLNWAFLSEKCPASVCSKLFTFSFSLVQLHVQPPNLPLLFLYESLRSVVSFWCHFKSKMANMATDWPRHFRLLLQNCCMWNQQTCQKCSSRGLEKYCLFRAIRNPTWLPQLLILMFCFIWIHQNYHRYSSRGFEEVLLIFVIIPNPRWPPCPLIGRNISFVSFPEKR